VRPQATQDILLAIAVVLCVAGLLLERAGNLTAGRACVAGATLLALGVIVSALVGRSRRRK